MVQETKEKCKKGKIERKERKELRREKKEEIGEKKGGLIRGRNRKRKII